MSGPKKRLGKGSQRLKFKDVSPRAEAGDQVHVGRKKDGEGVNLKYGGKVKMKEGGSLPDANKDGKISYADVLTLRGVKEKKKYGGQVEGYYRGGDVRTNPNRGQCY